MSVDYVAGTITGTIATLVGVGATILYERANRKEAERASQIKNIEMTVNELNDNLEIAKRNLALFQTNIEAIKIKKQNVTPPNQYSDDSWHVAQANGICSFISAENYKSIAGTYLSLSNVNAHITSRELFKLSNLALSNFFDILLVHDQVLEKKSALSIELIKQTVEILEQIRKNMLEQDSTRLATARKIISKYYK